MTFEIVRPDDEPGEPDAEAVAFRQAQENLRNAPGDLEARAQFRQALRLRRQARALCRRAGSVSVRWKRYRRLRELGYTPEGARWEIEQDAAEDEADYPNQKPANPPRSWHLARPLSWTRQTADETLRVKGVAELLVRARHEIAEARARGVAETLLTGGEPPADPLFAMPFELHQFLMVNGVRILTAQDPVAALQSLLGQEPPRRGRPPADNARRDCEIAVQVQEEVDGGSTVDEACHNVKNKNTARMIDFAAVRKIYFENRNRNDVKMIVYWRLLQKFEHHR